MAHLSKLFKNKNFFFLWFGQIISQLGDRLGQMALIGFVSLNIRGSSTEIAKALFFTILPVFLIGPVAGVYVDRWDRRKTLYICDLLRAILVLIIPLFLMQANTRFLVYLFIFLIFFCFKILWIMIKTYLNVLMSIVIAPLQILLGVVVPGAGFNQWLKGLIANLVVYPSVGIMFVLSFFFIVQAASIGSGSGGSQEWFQLLARIAPFQINTGFLGTVTAWDPPLTWGTGSGRFLWMLASFAVYMLIPKVADIIKSIIEGKPFAYGTAIGEAVQPARTMTGAALAGRYTYYTSSPPGPTSGAVHKVIGGLYQKASPTTKSMLDQAAKTIQGTVAGK
ncbi:MAG: MFS transporter [Candidatus Omnitrophica bacterium]|nr:MFS transporter [Candidatus Omnitrophota bacterium]